MDNDTAELLQWCLRILLALAFAGMGITHFVPGVVRGMAAMIPPAIRTAGPLRPRNLVYLTGLCEIAGAIGLLVPALHFAAGMALVVFLVAVFPANAYAAEHREKFGRAAIPFWPRFWGQLALIALCALAAL
ncbi:DoxX family protein [Parafrigoribacterium soli]|uniref:DoxX family protein n=1 Tax=Parafrigoribacterium soli TaxID=3144663 RepID=UPI0032EFF60C